jgi:hypothetical protein
MIKKKKKQVPEQDNRVPTGTSWLFKITNRLKFGKTSDTLPELPPIYTKPPLDTKKLLDTPPIFQILSLMTLLGKSAHYTLHSKTTPFCPKRRSFGPFLIFFFFFFFFFLKKRGKLATPLPKNGVAGPPPFWPRGGFGHPIRPVWGGRGLWGALPGGGFGHHESHQEKKKKKKKRNGFVPVGVARPPPRAWVWS